MNSKILYDKSGAFYPESDAPYIHSNALVDGSTVFKDLQTLHSQIAALTGADQIDGALSVSVSYGVCNSGDSETAKVLITNWSNTVQPPTIEAPYAWMKLQFYWTVGSTTTPLTPAYCSIATKSIETQTMYTSVRTLSGTEGLAGPSTFSTADAGLPDTAVEGVTWTYYFPGISEQNLYGLCATRIIEPASPNPIGDWKISRIAQYPTTS